MSPGLARTRIARCIVACLALLLAGGCAHTVPFTDARGRVVPGSVASMELVRIGGVNQCVWFRGSSTSNPPLILLHGGPGASESALFRRFNAELERHFLVVYWEQRGTGRSFNADIAPESMTITQLVRDLDEVVQLVRRRFHHDKVVLLAHSWGTVLGTLYAARHPERVAAYVGVAQIADMARGDHLSYAFAVAEARKRGNVAALLALQAIGPPPYPSVDARLAVGRWVERFGGSFHANLSTGKLIWAALRTDEADLVDLIQFGRGNRFSLERLHGELSQLDLTRSGRSFAVPVLFLLGRHDWQVPAVLAAQYFATIEAPLKRLVWFERSAHNPPFEEPEHFNSVLIREVKPLAARGHP